MKKVLEQEKEKMETFAMRQRVEVEEEMRETIKLTLLEQLKSQKEKFYDDERKLEEIRFAERKYKDEVRAKLEQQYQLESQMKNNRDKEQKTAKLRLIKEKLKEFDESPKKKKLDKEKSKVSRVEEDEKKEEKKEGVKIENLEEVKSRITEFPDFRESVFPKYKSSQNDKKKLRQQFECELFAFRKPEVYEPINREDEEEKNFIIKDFRSIVDKSVKENTSIKKEELGESEIKLNQEDSPIKNIKLDSIKEEEEEKSKTGIKLIKVKED